MDRWGRGKLWSVPPGQQPPPALDPGMQSHQQRVEMKALGAPQLREQERAWCPEIPPPHGLAAEKLGQQGPKAMKRR